MGRQALFISHKPGHLNYRDAAPDDLERIVAIYNSTNVAERNASLSLLETEDVETRYKADLEVLRNAIYARHGYSFRNPRMRALFHYVEWYIPVSVDVTGQLTETEKKNIALIKRYETHAGKYYDAFGR